MLQRPVRFTPALALLALAFVLALPATAAPAMRPAAACAIRATPSAGDGIVLNEILAGPTRDWDGSGAYSSRDDEWIEIANNGAAAVDLGSFFVTDADSIVRYAFSGTLAPGEVRLVTGKMSYDWEKANGKPAYGLSLGNTGDGVVLWRVVGADSVVVDAYAYDSHDAAADRSVGRALDSGEWTLYDGLDPYVGTLLPAGTGCMPTPGEPNRCVTTPAHTATWGRLKSLYR